MIISYLKNDKNLERGRSCRYKTRIKTPPKHMKDCLTYNIKSLVQASKVIMYNEFVSQVNLQLLQMQTTNHEHFNPVLNFSWKILNK